MISSRDIAQAEYIIDTSGIVDILIDGYRTSARGRRAPRETMRLMLLGLMLSIHTKGMATLTAAYSALRDDLTLDTQIRLGFRNAPNAQPNVTIHDFYNLEKVMRKRLSYVNTPQFNVDESEAVRRKAAVLSYCDALMDVFNLGWPTSSVAIDATGLWSWALKFSGATRSIINEFSSITEPEESAQYLATADSDTVATLFKRRDFEAQFGTKTGKDGRDETFFGFHEHTMVIVADVEHDKSEVPPLIVRFEITPANADVVAPTLGLLDRAGIDVKDLVADRHYHYKEASRWKAELDRRGIRQHHDLRSDEHGFTESDRLRWAAGWAHCPATPDALATIPRPGPNSSQAEQIEFSKKIDIREAYALQRHTPPDLNGKHRVRCPALDGKIGCPLRPGTEATAINFGLAIVAKPPNAQRDNEPLPKCCSQDTVMVTPPRSVYKLQQPHYWGSKKWERIWARRTYVEGSYGNRKNPSTENVTRGHNQIFGLVWAHIVMGLVNASYNLRMLENWCERNADHPFNTHPLIQGDNTAINVAGYVGLTAEEFEQITQQRAQAATRAA